MVRALTLCSVLVAAVAAAAPTRVLGFITVDGRHPALACERAEQRVATLTWSDGERVVETTLTCASAPALAFALELPEGPWRLEVKPEPDLGLRPFRATRPTRVSGQVLLVTVDVGRRAVSARPGWRPPAAPLRVAFRAPAE
jgi:hypothetical protein